MMMTVPCVCCLHQEASPSLHLHLDLDLRQPRELRVSPTVTFVRLRLRDHLSSYKFLGDYSARVLDSVSNPRRLVCLHVRFVQQTRVHSEQ